MNLYSDTFLVSTYKTCRAFHSYKKCTGLESDMLNLDIDTFTYKHVELFAMGAESCHSDTFMNILLGWKGRGGHWELTHHNQSLGVLHLVEIQEWSVRKTT